MKTIMTFAFVLTLCVAGRAQQPDQLKWMVGTWVLNLEKGHLVEQWKQRDDSTYIGKSMFVNASGDSLTQEFIELSYRMRQWTYIPTVAAQNDARPVRFSVVFVGRGEFISENPAHDFPQRIAYRRIKNGLYASIEGKRKGKWLKQNFDFTLED